MAMPASNGKLCTKLSDMSIGDYIRCEYVAPTADGYGTSKTSFRPVMEYVDNPKSTNIWY